MSTEKMVQEESEEIAENITEHDDTILLIITSMKSKIGSDMSYESNIKEIFCVKSMSLLCESYGRFINDLLSKHIIKNNDKAFVEKLKRFSTTESSLIVHRKMINQFDEMVHQFLGSDKVTPPMKYLINLIQGFLLHNIMGFEIEHLNNTKPWNKCRNIKYNYLKFNLCPCSWKFHDIYAGGNKEFTRKSFTDLQCTKYFISHNKLVNASCDTYSNIDFLYHLLQNNYECPAHQFYLSILQLSYPEVFRLCKHYLAYNFWSFSDGIVNKKGWKSKLLQFAQLKNDSGHLPLFFTLAM